MTAYNSRTNIAGILLGMFACSFMAQGASFVFYDESQFLTHAGTVAMESFETITNDHWIYDTRLPSPIPALDLDDDPNDPNDGPEYDLDGHFTITGNSIASAPADELFKVIDGAPIGDGVDGDQFLLFSPYYLSLWPNSFDPEEQHPIITFDNFNNLNSGINAFGLYLYNYTPGSPWIVLELGDEYVPINLSGTTDSYFIGIITSIHSTEVQLHTNQNGSSIKIDEIYFSSNASYVPEPSAMLLLVMGVIGIAILGDPRAKT